ncbi:MAG: hypothetical protein RIT45_1917 [Pseudomonadota bacterium]
MEGFRLHETALFHPASGTLLTADLVHNVGHPDHAWTALYTRMMGFHDRVALSRVLRWTAFSDRTAARRCVDRILDLPLERAVLGHGAPTPIPAARRPRSSLMTFVDSDLPATRPGPAPFHITEVLDIASLTELFEALTAVNDIVTALLDLQGKVLIATGWRGSCSICRTRSARR